MRVKQGKHAASVRSTEKAKPFDIQECQKLGLDKSQLCLMEHQLLLSGDSSSELIEGLAGPVKMWLGCPRCAVVMRAIPLCSRSGAAGPSSSKH